jgi:hypothetical protein
LIKLQLLKARKPDEHRMRRCHVFIASINRPALLFFYLSVINLFCIGLFAQPSPAAPDAATPPPQAQAVDSSTPRPSEQSVRTKDKSGQESKTPNSTSNDRLFFALPNFLTLENSAHVPPLTAGQKFKVVARGSFDPVQFVWYGFLSGISQAENSEPGYGQGAEGYGKRYGAAFADGAIENFMTSAAMSALFRQDPRFFQEGNGGFVHRAGYAVSRIVITRSDSGSQQFNFSEVLGSAMSAGISTYSYHPRSDRTLANTASVWGSEIGYDTLTIVLKEFWPDIRRKLRKK